MWFALDFRRKCLAFWMVFTLIGLTPQLSGNMKLPNWYGRQLFLSNKGLEFSLASGESEYQFFVLTKTCYCNSPLRPSRFAFVVLAENEIHLLLRNAFLIDYQLKLFETR